MKEKDYYTITELAKIFGISRVSIFKRVKQGSIKGQKIGYNFIIFKKDINIKKLFKVIKTNKTPS